ncbi:MAG: hypothetical protein AAFV36_05345 [Myxococcota bacterium]
MVAVHLAFGGQTPLWEITAIDGRSGAKKLYSAVERLEFPSPDGRFVCALTPMPVNGLDGYWYAHLACFSNEMALQTVTSVCSKDAVDGGVGALHFDAEPQLLKKRRGRFANIVTVKCR